MFLSINKVITIFSFFYCCLSGSVAKSINGRNKSLYGVRISVRGTHQLLEDASTSVCICFSVLYGKHDGKLTHHFHSGF